MKRMMKKSEKETAKSIDIEYEYALPPEKEYEYIESKRVCKDKFNIFKVAGIYEEDDSLGNIFIGSLIIGLSLILLGIVGLILILSKAQIKVGAGLVILPFFGISALPYGLKFKARAKKIYSTGKKYLARMYYDEINFNCVLCVDGKVIKNSAVGVSVKKKRDEIPVIYSKEFDEIMYLRLGELEKSSGSNAKVLDSEDNAIETHIALLHEKSDKRSVRLSRTVEGENRNRKGVFNIFATDKRANWFIAGLFYGVIFTIPSAIGIFVVNFYLDAVVPKAGIILINIFCSIVLLIGAVCLGCSIKPFIEISAIIKTSELYFAKITEKKRELVVRGSVDDEWSEERFSFVYEIKTDSGILSRTFKVCYSFESKNEIKKLAAFPVLYSQKHAAALYFSAKNCRILIDKYYKKNTPEQRD